MLPIWSGCATMLGLHNAAPSIAYSLVNVAPSNSIRVSDSSRVGIQPIGELTGVPAERAGKIAVTPVEAGDDVVQRRRAPRPRRGQGCASSTAPARESCCSKPSCPGTNSRVMTRDGSAASRCGLRVTSSARTRRHCGTVDKRRACCSVEITARVDSAPWLRFTRIGVQTVVSAARLRVPHELAGVVVALEPGRRGTDAVGPDASRVDGGGTRARIGERGHLDRLLIEARAGRRRALPADGGDRQVAVAPSRGRAARPAGPARVAAASCRRARRRPRSSPRREPRSRRSDGPRATATPCRTFGAGSDAA